MIFFDNFKKEEIIEIFEKSTSYAQVIEFLGGNRRNSYDLVILKDYIEKNNIDISHFYSKKNRILEIFKEDSQVSQHILRKYYERGNYSEYKCTLCGLTDWNGQYLSLTLDHINGKKNDNKIENLRWICPNCDSQLDTYCSKNKYGSQKTIIECIQCGKKINKNKTSLCIDCYNKKLKETKKMKNKEYKKYKKKYNRKKDYKCIQCGKIIQKTKTGLCLDCYNIQKASNSKIIPRDDLKKLIRNTPFTKIAELYGLTDNSIRKWCKKYNLPYKSSDIKKYTDEEWSKL